MRCWWTTIEDFGYRIGKSLLSASGPPHEHLQVTYYDLPNAETGSDDRGTSRRAEQPITSQLGQ